MFPVPWEISFKGMISSLRPWDCLHTYVLAVLSLFLWDFNPLTLWGWHFQYPTIICNPKLGCIHLAWLPCLSPLLPGKM